MILAVRRLAFASALLICAGACFATRADVRTLQGDIATLRAFQARTDTLRRAQVQAVALQVGAATDSLRAINAFLARFSSDVSRFQGDLATTLRSFGQQLIAVQERMGQSQKSIQELRADLEAKSTELVASASGQPPAGVAAQPPASTAAGPLTLLQLARSQFNGGRLAAARAGYQEFIAQFPTNPLVAEALYGIAQTYDFESNLTAADSAYQLVVDKYPKSDRAPMALYKRAIIIRKGGPTQAARARALFQQIVDKYPGSPEADLARDNLKTPH